MPESDDRVTVWLNPDLSSGANDSYKVPTSSPLQSRRVVRRDPALPPRRGQGWIFSNIAIAPRLRILCRFRFGSGDGDQLWDRGCLRGIAFMMLYRERRIASQRIHQLKREQAVLRSAGALPRICTMIWVCGSRNLAAGGHCREQWKHP